MRTLSRLIALIVFIAVTGKTEGQNHPSGQTHGGSHVMVNADDLKWVDGPASLPKGAKVALLEGNPGEAGPFTLRLMVPANYEIKPHWHPAIEHVSVIKGSFSMGAGESFDKAKATVINEGGFAVMPEKFVHYAFSPDGATIQLHGIGPWQIIYVKDSDDPRKSQ